MTASRVALDAAMRLLADLIAGLGSSVPLDPQAVVATVTAGGAADGQAAVTVTWMGGTYPATYLASYTPTVGHIVLVLYLNGHLVILGRNRGTPA